MSEFGVIMVPCEQAKALNRERWNALAADQPERAQHFQTEIREHMEIY